MKIIADEKILYVREAFGGIGDLEMLPAKEITRTRIQSADILVLRSVTSINRQLLDGVPVRMVVTASIGTDHVDLRYISGREIRFASAAGGNANSVAEYVMAVIVRWLVERERTFAETTLGVIGIGNIGSLVAEMAGGLGMMVLRNDPPMAERRDDLSFLPLEQVLESDIVTLHVPLTKEGRHPTFNLVDSKHLGRIKPGSMLINTSRGRVLDQATLKRTLNEGRDLAAALDVWQNEPDIDLGLIGQLYVATPHIAGHSLDGKANCTLVAYRAVCEFLGVEPDWSPERNLPKPEHPVLKVRSGTASEEVALNDVIRQAYDTSQDDRDFRELARDSTDNFPSAFQRFRDKYRVRREFHNFEVDVREANEALQEKLRALGFRVSGG